MATPSQVPGTSAIIYESATSTVADVIHFADNPGTGPGDNQVLNTILSMDPTRQPALVLIAAIGGVAPQTGSASATVGGFAAQVIVFDGGANSPTDVELITVAVILPFDSSFTFTDANTIITIPGMGTGGPPYVYGAGNQVFFMYGVDPTINAGFGAGHTNNAGNVISTVGTLTAQAGDAAFAVACSRRDTSELAYTLTNPATDYQQNQGSGLLNTTMGVSFNVAAGSLVSALTNDGAPFDHLGAGMMFLLRGTPFVPDVVGLPLSDGEAAIVAASFTVGTTVSVVDPSPPGTIVSQNPTGGSSALPGASVDLTYSQGIVVPNVVNTSLSVIAPAILTAAGFVVGAVTYEASGVIIAGNVIRQSPTAGSYAAGGSGVNLVVSSGLPALRVPDIFEMSQADAINAIETLGLVVGSIGSAPSQFVPPGTVQLQNPSAGAPVAVGSIVSFVLSLGNPAVGTAFDFEATVISQYANSPVIMQLVQNLNEYIDQSTNFANFFNFLWNVDTAVGFGLDIWGKIVGVVRLLHIPNTTDYVGFDNSATPPPDWQTMGSTQTPGGPVGGAMYTGNNATSTYLLPDDAYRQLILAKAFANICTTTAPAINQILQNLYGPGTAWVLNTGTMSISYNLSFTPSAIQLAILEQSGIIPTPPGVSVVINTGV